MNHAWILNCLVSPSKYQNNIDRVRANTEDSVTDYTSRSLRLSIKCLRFDDIESLDIYVTAAIDIHGRPNTYVVITTALRAIVIKYA